MHGRGQFLLYLKKCLKKGKREERGGRKWGERGRHEPLTRLRVNSPCSPPRFFFVPLTPVLATVFWGAITRKGVGRERPLGKRAWRVVGGRLVWTRSNLSPIKHRFFFATLLRYMFLGFLLWMPHAWSTCSPFSPRCSPFLPYPSCTSPRLW